MRSDVCHICHVTIFHLKGALFNLSTNWIPSLRFRVWDFHLPYAQDKSHGIAYYGLGGKVDLLRSPGGY